MCQQLIKFLLIRSMRSFGLSIKLWRSRFDIYIPYPFVLDMPMKLGLKLMASVYSDRMDTEREFFDHIINKLYGILLIMTRVDFQRSFPGGIINSCILKASDSVALKIPQTGKFDINLNMMPRNFFGVTSRLNSPTW